MGLAVFGEVPGLLIPLVFIEQPEADLAGGRLAGAHLLVRLDLRTISGEIFPVLTRRFFDDERGGDYALAVTNPYAPASARVVFLSDPSVPAASFGAGDLSLGLLRPWPFEEMHALWQQRRARRCARCVVTISIAMVAPSSVRIPRLIHRL